jgi:tRNA(Ile)-lysidine synthase
MLRLLMPVPRNIYIAVSGGPDSMACLDFLRRKHNVVAVHYNHGTEHGKEAEEFVVREMNRLGITAVIGKTSEQPPKGRSKEEFWRAKRYDFFTKVAGKGTLVLAHTLDDAVETWVFSCLHGNPKVIPPQRDNIIRPFLLCKKAALLAWCVDNDVPYIMDPGNTDVRYMRSLIRKDIIPNLLKVNPGLAKVIYKKYLKMREI